MKKEKILGIARHTLTFIGGILVTKGLFDASVWAEISGSVITLSGLIWSVIDKK
jgi:hypothetical protein